MDRLLNAIRGDAARLDGLHAQPRLATIESYDPDEHAARVRIEPDGALSGWVPVSALAVGNGIGVVAPPSPGDQVLVVAQEGDAEHLVVVGRIFSIRARPPVSPATGAAVKPGEVAVFTEGAWLHVAGGVIHAEATELRYRGKLSVDGDIAATGDVTAGSVSLRQHRHAGVRSGGDTSGPPV